MIIRVVAHNIFEVKMTLKITSDNKVSNEYGTDYESGSGEYLFRYINSDAPAYFREDVQWKSAPYGYTRTVAYRLWYNDGKWSLTRKDKSDDWEKGVVVFRQKTDCKLFICFFID